MTDDEFSDGWTRILGNFGEVSDGVKREVSRRYQDIDGSLWKRMVTWVIDNCKFAPRGADFKKGREACTPSWVTDRNANDDAWCPSCQSTNGFKYVYFLANGSIPYTGVEPCKNCNGVVAAGRSRTKIEKYLSRDDFEARIDQYRLEHPRASTPFRLRAPIVHIGAAVKAETPKADTASTASASDIDGDIPF